MTRKKSRDPVDIETTPVSAEVEPTPLELEPRRKGPLAIRLDPLTLARLKMHAAKLNVGYQTLLKCLLIRGLHDLDNAAFITFPAGLRKKRVNTPTSTVEPAKAEPAPEPEAVPEPVVPKIKAAMPDAEIDDLFENL
jgi:hypothetical protein